MGPKGAAEALVLRPGSRFEKNGFLGVFAHLCLQDSSRRTKRAASGARAASAMVRNLVQLNASVLRPLATLASGARAGRV